MRDRIPLACDAVALGTPGGEVAPRCYRADPPRTVEACSTPGRVRQMRLPYREEVGSFADFEYAHQCAPGASHDLLTHNSEGGLVRAASGARRFDNPFRHSRRC